MNTSRPASRRACAYELHESRAASHTSLMSVINLTKLNKASRTLQIIPLKYGFSIWCLSTSGLSKLSVQNVCLMKLLVTDTVTEGIAVRATVIRIYIQAQYLMKYSVPSEALYSLTTSSAVDRSV